MRRCGISGIEALLVVSAVLLAACSKGPAPPAQQAAAPAQAPAQPAAQPSAQPLAASGQPAQSIPSPAGIASGEFSGNPDLRCDLLEVKRVSGGALLIRWRILNIGSQPKPINYDFDWPQIYYIDPAENKKYGYLTDANGGKILDVFWGDLPAGQQRGNWAKFPAPPPTSNKISVNIPKFPPFEDVPISQ
jgi:hypothetical protein